MQYTKNFDINQIKKCLEQINDTVQKVHGDVDDDVGAIVWNNVLSIAEELGIEL